MRIWNGVFSLLIWIGIELRGYYYTEDKFCFYICNSCYEDYKIPLRKEVGLYVISRNAVEGMINDLNEKDSDLFLDFIGLYNEINIKKEK